MLERDGSAGGCRAAQLATPNNAPDIAKNITIAAHILILVRRVIDDRVDSTRDKIPAGIAGPRDVAIAGTLPGGYFEVPSRCYDETVAAACERIPSGEGRPTFCVVVLSAREETPRQWREVVSWWGCKSWLRY